MGNVEAQFYNEALRHVDAPIDEVNVKACIATAETLLNGRND